MIVFKPSIMKSYWLFWLGSSVMAVSHHIQACSTNKPWSASFYLLILINHDGSIDDYDHHTIKITIIVPAIMAMFEELDLCFSMGFLWFPIRFPWFFYSLPRDLTWWKASQPSPQPPRTATSDAPPVTCTSIRKNGWLSHGRAAVKPCFGGISGGM